MRDRDYTARRAVIVAFIVLIARTALADCPVVDLETPMLIVASNTAGQDSATRVAAFRRDVVARAPLAFAPDVLGFANDAAVDHAAQAALSKSETGDGERATLAKVAQGLPLAELAFRRTFADFRCDFEIYMMNSLGSLDGAGRRVAGRPALVFGVDQIAAEGDSLVLPAFLVHELFHRYHARVAGFSDDPGEHQAIWRSLWAEGLATYVAFRLVPSTTVDQALMLPPDLRLRANPQLQRIAADLLTHFEKEDHATFAAYFLYGSAEGTERAVPWRSGYYVGFLTARALSRRWSLVELAHLHGPALRREIRIALRAMAEGAPNTQRRGE